jgi:hypothetical protein
MRYGGTILIPRSPHGEFVLTSVGITNNSRDSSVGIATGYGLDDRMIGVRFAVELRIFLFTTRCRPALGPTQLPIQWEPGALSPGGNMVGA